MRILRKKLLTALAIFMLMGAARAMEVDVGRITVVLPTDDWMEISLIDPGLPYQGDVTGRLKSETKALVRTTPDGQLDALLIVRANAAGFGGGRAATMVYSAVCPLELHIYSEGSEAGPHATAMHCLVVAPPTDIQRLTNPAVVEVREQLKQRGIAIQGAFSVFQAQQHASTSAFTFVLAYMRPDVFAESGPPEEGAQPWPVVLPPGVEIGQVQWGQKLLQASKQSVYSILGRLALPPVSTDAPK